MAAGHRAQRGACVLDRGEHGATLMADRAKSGASDARHQPDAVGTRPHAPWMVARADFDRSAQRIDIHIDFSPGSRFACPACGAVCPVHDTEQKFWRHLNFFQHQGSKGPAVRKRTVRNVNRGGIPAREADCVAEAARNCLLLRAIRLAWNVAPDPGILHAINQGSTRGMALRAIQTRTQLAAPDPAWLTAFLDDLARADLAPATRRGYGYDLRHFLAWHAGIRDGGFALGRLAAHDLIAYRQHLLAANRRPATINRRLDALRRLCRWAHGTGSLSTDVAHGLRPVRTVRNRQPAGLTDAEAYALLRAAGASLRGLAARNYALVQMMLQAGLRVGEAASLQIGDVTLHDRSGSVRIRAGKGLKAREVPLNGTARRALRQYLGDRGGRPAVEPLFLSSR